MAIELGIATPAVPRDPRALDDRFGKWMADLGVTVLGTHLGPTPEDVAPVAGEVRERMAGWGLRIVQATGYNPGLVGDDQAQRATDLERLTPLIEAGQVVPSIDRTYPLAHVAEAMRHLIAGEVRGKVAITI